MATFHWSKSNTKATKTAEAWAQRFGTRARIVGFNLPQLRSESGQVTCPYAGYCADLCFAAQGSFRWRATREAYERNMAAVATAAAPYKHAETKAASVGFGIIEDLNAMRGVTHVRIHDSGDFFARWYFEAWRKVAEHTPGITFYAYTKSLPFLQWDAHPPNFRLVQSVGGTRDKDIDYTRPHSRIFATTADRERAGYVDGNASDLPAILGQKRIGLVYHGDTKLTADQVVQLRTP